MAVVADAIGAPFPRPLAHRVDRSTIRLPASVPGGVLGDLYRPRAVPEIGLGASGAPAIVLAPGGDPAGKDDSRIVALARALAGARRTVFVPQLDLRRRELSAEDVERLVGAVRELSRGGVSVGLLGISYGGSLCLLAAEDGRIARTVAFVAVFGSFLSLAAVVQGVTTGATVYGGAVHRWRAAPEARAILVGAAERLAPPADRAPLANALVGRNPAGLSSGAQAIYALLTNREPRRVRALVANLPPSFRGELERFSPATHLRALRAPLFVMQSVNDPATPPTEALALHAAVPGSRLIVLHWFLHVTPPGRGTPLRGELADLWGAIRFAGWVLAAQE